MKKYDYTIIGSGLFGAVFAQVMRENDWRVQVFEKRDHIGGNVYCENRDGIDVHMYGPHIFHTNSDEVWRYINRFVSFNNYFHRVRSHAGGRFYVMPINLATIQAVYPHIQNPREAAELFSSFPFVGDSNLEQWAISQVGQEMYNLFIKGYTEKQWNRPAYTLPASIVKRLPVRFNYDDTYFKSAKHQGIPVEGYNGLIERLLDGIEVQKKVSFSYADYHPSMGTLVWTGPIDGFYDTCYGSLEYRSLNFDHNFCREVDYQGIAQMNHPDATVPYTRMIEHKHFLTHKSELLRTPGTWVTTEYPVEKGDPYYPVRDAANVERLKRYQAIEPDIPVIFGGRLGSYQYWDMDQTVASAISRAKEEIVREL